MKDGRVILGAAAGVGVAAIIVFLAYSPGDTVDKGTGAPDLGSDIGASYADLHNVLKTSLEAVEISMSSPVRLADQDDIAAYCGFLGQAVGPIQYCTSSELRDRAGAFLGNVHMLGGTGEPETVVAAIQVDHNLEKKDDAKAAFSVLVKEIVCDCWYDAGQAGISLDEWAEAHIMTHVDRGSRPTASETSLAQKSLSMILFSNADGYEWQMHIK